MKINIVTIFPGFFEGPLSLSIPARAAAKGLVSYHIVDLREYTHDKHRTVDDYPFGGGAGMVMKPAPFFEAVDALHYLRRLWSLLVEDLAKPENDLPEQLRADLISIGLWVIREAEQIRLEKSTNFRGLIEVSQNIRDGLAA